MVSVPVVLEVPLPDDVEVDAVRLDRVRVLVRRRARTARVPEFGMPGRLLVSRPTVAAGKLPGLFSTRLHAADRDLVVGLDVPVVERARQARDRLPDHADRPGVGRLGLDERIADVDAEHRRRAVGGRPVTGQRTGSFAVVKPADAFAVPVSYRPGARNAVAHVPRSTSDGITVHLAPIFGFHVPPTSE